MDSMAQNNNTTPEPPCEEAAQKLAKAQLALGDSLSSTSQFLRFALNIARENLDIIRTQLEIIRDLSTDVGQQERD